MQSSLDDIFGKLDDSEKLVLFGYTLHLEPVSQLSMVDFLEDIGVRREDGEPLMSRDVGAIKRRLMRLNLLVEPQGAYGNMTIAPEYFSTLWDKVAEHPKVEKMVEVIRREYPVSVEAFFKEEDLPSYIRELRFCLLMDDGKRFVEFWEYLNQEGRLEDRAILLERVFGKPFNPYYLAKASTTIQAEVIRFWLERKLLHFEDWGPVQEVLEEKAKSLDNFEFSPYFKQQLSYALMTGVGVEEGLKEEDYRADLLPYIGWEAFLKGNNEKAILAFEKGLSEIKKREGKHHDFFSQPYAPFFILSLIKTQDPAQWQLAEKYLKQGKEILGREVLRAILAFLQNDSEKGFTLVWKPRQGDVLTEIIYCHCCLWFCPEELQDPDILKELSTLLERAKSAKLNWAVMELTTILVEIQGEESPLKEELESITSDSKFVSIKSCIQRVPEWQRALKALESISSDQPRKRSDASANESRVVWLIDPLNQEIQPKLQKLGKSGWSLGRNIALKTLRENGAEGMTDQDRRIASAIVTEVTGYGYGQGENFHWDEEKALREMVGHPLLFLYDAPKVACELVLGKPELEVSQNEEGFMIEITEDSSETGIRCVKETPTRFKLIDITPTHVRVFNALGGDRLQVPKEGAGQVANILGSLSRLMTVHSDLEQSTATAVECEPDTIPHVHLLPVGDGFKLEIFTKPFRDFPPYFHPGEGRENVLATDAHHQAFKVRRSLKEERHQAIALVKNSVALSMTDSGNWEWNFQTPESCLEVLSDLQGLQKDCILEWPEGEKLKITHAISTQDLSLKIGKKNNWFSLSGEVRLDDNKVLSLQELLRMVGNTNSRFIALSEGQFLALSDSFRKRLKELEVYTNKDGQDLVIHPLVSGALEDFTKEVGNLNVDSAWKEQLERLKSIRSHLPDVPSTLQADLRSYQEEGYHWLSQLCYWGVGACLADDMGLGKTLQAISLMLEKASNGPSLVIAPSSVCPNWVKEVGKFAPTLNVQLFGEGDRKETIENLGKFDLLVVSYGLLISEDELLTEKDWNIICIDEAQAIKNAGTKRSKTAMMLKGDFRMLTTGTPVENHLGELWNLFQFLNPGLLGSLNQFNDRFALPIERDRDLERKHQLKKLIHPFILRRRKNQVLDELPEKTEVTLSVEMGDEETHFYEALRRDSLQKLEEMQGEASGQQFQILAELTKLRQASCHPRLVAKDSAIPSSKLELFGELLQEILEGGHKVLVFSQFVSHLSLIREKLAMMKVSYQYLDGSTPLKKREQSIEDFQSGKGEVFLISLKAGGVGLNLTAADYVIHMDPWWNPAVEDQATDRAHRIGQQRPVTVYRLVTKNTIEEKIVKLHHDKRDLADSLLEGTEASGKLSANELLDLMKE